VAGLNYIANRLKTGEFGQMDAGGTGKRRSQKLGKSTAEKDSQKKSLFSFLNKGR